MRPDHPLGYTEEEIKSFMPTGWKLANPTLGPDGTEGTWDAKQRAWRVDVCDGVDFEYPLVVRYAEVSTLGANGRIEALRRAFDKLYRERLG
jgi:hypothetical protein